MDTNAKEFCVKGVPISKGIAIGKPFFFTLTETDCPEYTIDIEDIEKEILRYRRAVEASCRDVERLQRRLEREGVTEAAAILETHLHMMQDMMLTVEVEQGIRLKRNNAESVFCYVIKKCKKKFMALPDPFFRERYKDIKDVARRILGHLCETGVNPLAQVPARAVVVAHELPASDAAEATAATVSAFVTATGGATSHAAIVAKARGIPCVTEIDVALMQNHRECDVVVDGCKGEIIINPSSSTLRKYRKIQKQLESYFCHLTKESRLEAETYDGYSVSLFANVEISGELDMLHQYGGKGVGLFRSEYIFLSRDHIPSEDEQFVIYKGLVEKMKGLPIVMRVFDIGGDKFSHIDELPYEETRNLLGCRAIRFLLKEREIFKTQMRAILRAAAFGDVRVMFPMVEGPGEFLDAKAVVEETQSELANEGFVLDKKIPVGCMVEVPSAAIMADALAQECDFLSIGTNDLVQYCLAADRSDQVMSVTYTPSHPSIIRLIKLIITAAAHHDIPVTVCGEMAADPHFTPLLLGLGIREFSVALRYLPIVKKAIRSTSLIEATELAEKVMLLTKDHEIRELLASYYHKHAPDKEDPDFETM